VYEMYKPFLLAVWGFLDFSVHITSEPFLLPVWSFPVISGLFCAGKYEPFLLPVWGFPVSSGHFVYEMHEQFLLTSVGFSSFVLEIFDVRTTSTDHTGARSGSPQLSYILHQINLT